MIFWSRLPVVVRALVTGGIAALAGDERLLDPVVCERLHSPIQAAKDR